MRPRTCRDVGEGAVPVVVVERVAPGIADEKVGIPVVVVIPGGHAKTEVQIGPRETCLLGDVFKRPVASVAQEAVVEGRVRLLQLRKLGAVGEEDVVVPVAVIIEDGDPAAHRLGKILMAGEVVVGDVCKPRKGSDILEGDGLADWGGKRRAASTCWVRAFRRRGQQLIAEPQRLKSGNAEERDDLLLQTEKGLSQDKLTRRAEVRRHDISSAPR